MALLNESDIARLGQLARLEMDPEKTAQACGHINAFFNIVEKMAAVDTQGVAPLHHPVGLVQNIALRLRDDVVSEPNQRELNQQSAPAVENGLFLVPRVIE